MKTILIVLITIITTILMIIKRISSYLEHKLIFLPTKLKQNYNFKCSDHTDVMRSIANKDVNITEHTIKTKDDNKINVLYYQNPHTPCTILYAHGNGGNLCNIEHVIDEFGKYCSIVLFDYRGYGKSTGQPTEEGVYDDIHSVWNWLIDQDVKPDSIVLYGYSLGSSIAAWLASRLADTDQKPRLLVMQAGFSCIKDIAGDLVPQWLTVLMQTRFSSTEYVRTIGNKIPIIISHSKHDEIINIRHKDRLVKANPHAQFQEIKGTHNEPRMGRKFLKSLQQHLNYDTEKAS